MKKEHNPAVIFLARVNSNFNHAGKSRHAVIFLVSIVDCTWDEWSTWEICSVSCGGGTQERNRTKVAAQHGGADCVGNDRETQSCNDNVCPGKF